MRPNNIQHVYCHGINVDFTVDLSTLACRSLCDVLALCQRLVALCLQREAAWASPRAAQWRRNLAAGATMRLGHQLMMTRTSAAFSCRGASSHRWLTRVDCSWWWQQRDSFSRRLPPTTSASLHSLSQSFTHLLELLRPFSYRNLRVSEMVSDLKLLDDDMDWKYKLASKNVPSYFCHCQLLLLLLLCSV